MALTKVTSSLTDLDGGITIDNITIDGTEIDLSSGDLTIDVAGNITLDADDAGEIRFKDGGTQYATIKKDGNNALIQSIVADGDLHFMGIDGSSFITPMQIDMSEGGNVGIGAAPTLGALHVTSSLTDIVTFENTSTGTTGSQLLLYHNSSSPADGDRVGALAFQGEDDAGNHTTYAGIRCLATDVSDGSEDGTLTFSCTRGGTFTEAMRIASDGKVLINTTSTVGTSTALVEFNNLGSGGRVINTKDNGTGSCNAITFNNNNGQVGRITTDGSGTSYVTSSDYRMKENLVYEWEAISKIKNLKPVQFNFKTNPDELTEGFIADEAQSIVPYAVVGEKDGKEMQGMDYGKLTAILTKAIQEQQTIIEDLKSRIETLEG